MSFDVAFINPSNAKGIYQGLADKYAAIEPPTWALLLAESVRSVGFKPVIFDTNAQRESDAYFVEEIKRLKVRLICFVVYGQNVNAGTVSMSGAVRLARSLKESGVKAPIAFVGSYVQALPIKALKDENCIDFVFTNEGVYALREVLALSDMSSAQLENIRGIAWRPPGEAPKLNPVSRVVPNDRMDIDLPGYAWDLLPKRNAPLDLYRAPLWHAGYVEEERSPYAALQTSLGCRFGCSFCMINIINRDDTAEIGVASNYSNMRFWSPGFVLNQFDRLDSMGIRTIRIVDEMFLLTRKYYVPICEGLASRPYAKDLRMWAYSRVDTVTNPDLLRLVRSAGIRWLCLGIESASREVRLEVSKGKFEDVDIKRVIEQVHEADIEVMANYIVGLPTDSKESMEATQQMSEDLCTSGWNMYAAMALPGSDLYRVALEKGYPLPQDYVGYSFHAYETQPMPTDILSAAEVLGFRDEAFQRYHTNPKFLARIETRFGPSARENIENMTKVKLKRQILEESKL